MAMSKDKKWKRNLEDLTEAVEAKVQLLLKEGAHVSMGIEWLRPELPESFDKEKFELGQRTFYNNVFTMMIAKLSGLVSLLAIPSVLEVLMFTQQSSTPCTAFRRYVGTILHTWTWYGREKSSDQNKFLESLKIVRKKHCVAFRRCADAGLRKATQLDMALAQFGFIGFTILSGDYLGVNATYEELDSLVYFWHVIGSMLGMEEKYNLCTGTLEETRALFRRILDEVFLPALANRSKNFEMMNRNLIEGLWPVNPQLDTDANLIFTLMLASSAATNNNHSIEIDTSKLSRYGRFLLNFQLFVHKYLLPTHYWWSKYFRAFFNSQMRLSIFLTEKFPFLAYYEFGWKKSHVNIFAYRVN